MAHEAPPLDSRSQSARTVDSTVRREHLITALAEAGRPVDVDDLATDLCDRLRTGQGTERPGIDRTECRIHLYHSDLPKLASEGVVDFDAAESTATLREEGLGERP